MTPNHEDTVSGATDDAPATVEGHYIKTDTGLYWCGVAGGWTPDPDQAARIPSERIEDELEAALEHAGYCALYVGTWPPGTDA